MDYCLQNHWVADLWDLSVLTSISSNEAFFTLYEQFPLAVRYSDYLVTWLVFIMDMVPGKFDWQIDC